MSTQPPPPTRRKGEEDEAEQAEKDDGDDWEGVDGGDDDGGEGGDDDGNGDGQGEDGDPIALNSTLRIPCQVQAATAAGTLSDTGCYRYAFVPRTHPVAGVYSPPTASKFGGAPFLLPTDISEVRPTGRFCLVSSADYRDPALDFRDTDAELLSRASSPASQLNTDTENTIIDRIPSPPPPPIPSPPHSSLDSSHAAGRTCECGGKMAFASQLRADDLPAQLGDVFVPERLRGDKFTPMFQLWSCAAHMPLANHNARWKDATGPSATPTTAPALDTNRRDALGNRLGRGPEEALLGWEQPRIDTPNSMEQEDVWVIAKVNDNATPIMGPKLSGFPHWVQDCCYTQCSICQSRMELLFEMYDDVFSTYSMVCPTHREEFGMEAQCG